MVMIEGSLIVFGVMIRSVWTYVLLLTGNANMYQLLDRPRIFLLGTIVRSLAFSDR